MQPVLYSGYPTPFRRKSLQMQDETFHTTLSSLQDLGRFQDNWLHDCTDDASPHVIMPDSANSQAMSPVLSQVDTADSDGDSCSRRVTRLSLNDAQDAARSSCLELGDQDCFSSNMQPTHSFSCLNPDLQLGVDELTSLSSSSPFIRAIHKAKKRRGSIGELHRQETMAAFVEPRQTKSSIQILGRRPRHSDMAKPHPRFDSSMDTSDLLRAKITGITRSMQEFHVHELFQDELTKRDLKRGRHHTTNGISPFEWPADDMFDPTPSCHRRIRSHGSVRYSNLPPLSPTPEPHQYLRTDDETDDHDSIHKPTSPNLTALFWTTNSLIHSRLDELSETASIASSCDLSSTAAEWRSQFLSLVSACITHSEELESLSTELLGAELKVRELTALNETFEEQFTEHEKMYTECLRECQDAETKQLIMMDTLDELLADLDKTLEQLVRYQDISQQKAAKNTEPESEPEPEPNQGRWDFSQSIAHILNLESKDDLVHKMRWEVGMFVGGGVGTGHIIHTFEGQLHGIEMMIAGSGATVVKQENSPSQPQVHSSHSTSTPADRDLESIHVSPSLRHAKFYCHQYMLHLRPEERRTRFQLLPRAHWIPDHQVDQCQFEGRRRCPARFSFFQRRHHCRRCGKVICKYHSGNKLPLFRKASDVAEWSRVCDQCFSDLVTTQD